ncbi:MAG: ATP phosphoribosyltransferase regulatory subunit, partial [Bacteroidota bacterium]|nr:ATP phosphoribosyltransferase regulatory subunit [Bacteroidota bacterium]
EFIIKLNNRKIVKGFLSNIGINNEQENEVMRIIDKLDKIGVEGVIEELGKGRKDQNSGAFIAGLELNENITDNIKFLLESFNSKSSRKEILTELQKLNIDNDIYKQGIEELSQIDEILTNTGFDETRVIIDPSMIRGMGYYTGAIFEAEYLGTYKDAKGRKRKVGSICGGGRYDGLVKNLIGLTVPATGASIGVDRLAEIMTLTGKTLEKVSGPVFIVYFDDNLMTEYQKIAAELRNKGIKTEIYYGAKRNLKHQLSYADKKNCPIAILLGENEHNNGVVTVRNLKLGKEIAHTITDKKEWTAKVQKEVKRSDIAEQILKMIN